MPTPLFPLPDAVARILARLPGLFAQMDAAYDKAAAAYGFICRGCGDNCCQTRFFHHTYAEYLYLLEGMAALPDDVRNAVLERAGADDEDLPGSRRWCPLNQEGRCLLYAHRPMICRLHGLPHEVRRPGHPPAYSPGCGAFMDRHGGAGYHPFDRTSLYLELSRLEGELRARLGVNRRISLTIAGMLTHMEPIPFS